MINRVATSNRQGKWSVAFGVVLSRLAYLQIWRHDDLVARAENQSSRVVRPAPRRGPILDREGRVLVESVRTGSCFADPAMVRRPEAVAHRLADILDMPAREVAEKIRKSDSSFVWLKRFLPVEQARAVEQANLFGVGLKWEYRRAYPNGPMAAPAPTSATVRSRRSSQSGLRTTAPTASAKSGSVMPRATQRFSWRSRASPWSTSPS